MADRIVYWLGAGFSAPLGLPIMSNFLAKAKDQYFSSPDEYAHFKDIFHLVDRLSRIKNYFSSDQFNIEEILSILDMQSQLLEDGARDEFARFIVDVITHHTPQVEFPYGDRAPGNWQDHIWGAGKINVTYGYFVANLIKLRVIEVNSRAPTRDRFQVRRLENLPYQYDVITLNYDTVINDRAEYFSENLDVENSRFGVAKDFDHETGLPESVIARLHGSVETGNVVAPTWSKALSPEIIPEWKCASKLLEMANHIRIIGYSLPTTDAYVKYLFKAAMLHSKNLKSIDVICLDPDGSVRPRYDDFIDTYFPSYRFADASVEEYLEQNFQKRGRPTGARLDCATLEAAHAEFFENRS